MRVSHGQEWVPVSTEMSESESEAVTEWEWEWALAWER